MIKATLYDDIVWKRCGNCSNLVVAEVKVVSIPHYLCEHCLRRLAEEATNASEEYTRRKNNEQR